MSVAAPSAPLTVRQLRRRWKPHKERLLDQQTDQSTSVRIHRACSWLGIVERMGERPDYDQALLCQWIAFNALYGQWDKQKQEPMADRPSWRLFMDRILALDAEGQVAEVLKSQRGLVMKMLDDEYSANNEEKMMEDYGIDDESCDDLPRGVLIGTVELYDCEGGDWHVRKPERAKRMRKPKKHPQPVWFNPF